MECQATQWIGSSGNDVVKQLDVSVLRDVAEDFDRVVGMTSKTEASVITMEILEIGVYTPIKQPVKIFSGSCTVSRRPLAMGRTYS
jgi:hypothetical protein